MTFETFKNESRYDSGNNKISEETRARIKTFGSRVIDIMDL